MIIASFWADTTSILLLAKVLSSSKKSPTSTPKHTLQENSNMDHSPLISEKFPSIVLNPTDALYDKTASAIHEVEARK